jgi:hypothetical protein
VNKAVTNLKPESEVAPDPLELLRRPFLPHQVSKLPKPTKAQTDAVKADYKKGIRCGVCGAWHHPDVVHLDYVGHAALTDRLLDADPQWFWEPVAFGDDGLPAFDKTGGLWIKLTVCGVTRLGYGHAAVKPNQDPGAREKEVIGDALRNAAMRFGAALDLWHKGDLHAEEPEASAPTMEDRAIAHLKSCAIDRGLFKDAWEANREGWKKTLDTPAYARVIKVMKELAAALPEEAPPPQPSASPADDFGLGDDEIPF